MLREKAKRLAISLSIVWLLFSPLLFVDAAKADAPGLTVDVYTYDPLNLPDPAPATFCLTTSVDQINQDWGGGDVFGCGGDFVLAHYYGFVTWPTSETVAFQSLADDGFMLNIGGQSVINDWQLKGCSGNGGSYDFQAGVSEPIDVWFYEYGGGACNILYATDSTGFNVVPADRFTTQAQPMVVPEPVVTPDPTPVPDLSVDVRPVDPVTEEVHPVDQVTAEVRPVEPPVAIPDPTPVVPDPAPAPVVEQPPAVIPDPPVVAPSPEPAPAPEPSPEPQPEPATPTVDPAPVEPPAVTPEPPAVEPDPVATPDPTPVVEPDPVAVPDPTPTVEPTPDPAPVVDPTPTPKPTPDPVATPEPAPTPVVDPVPVQPAPEVTPVAVVPVTTPEPTPEPAPAPVTQEEVLQALAEQAQADDPQLPEALAAIPVLGNVASAVLDTFNQLGNLGADMTPEARAKAKKEVVAAVIVTQIAGTVTSVAVSASGGSTPAARRRTKE